MKRLSLAMAVMSVAFAAGNETPFTGTWRVDLKKMQPPKKSVQIEIANGMYKCLTCDPKWEVKANGQDQTVSGNPYLDTANVKIVDDKTVTVTTKKGGKTIDEMTATVSGDNQHTTVKDTSHPVNGSEAVNSTMMLRREGSPPAGMHVASGSWVMEKMDLSENGKEVTLEQTGDGLNYSDPTGVRYSAKFDGKEYPVEGGTAPATVMLKRAGPRSIEETDKTEGKVTGTSRMTVSPDGKTLTVEWRSSNGFSGKQVFERK